MTSDQTLNPPQTNKSSSITLFAKGPSVLLAIYSLCIYLNQPAFFSFSNLGSILYYTCLLVPALLGVYLLVVLGQFDLSVGSVAALAGVIAALSIKAGCPIGLCVVLAFFAGAIFGTINWLLVSKMRIPALVGTLITMAAARAAALGLSEGQVVGGVSNNLAGLTLGIAGSVSPAIWLGLALVAALAFLSKQHVIIRHMHLAGSNRDAVMSTGINVSNLEWIAFVCAGIGASLVGVLQCSRTLSASPLSFPDLALECIAACVIGGARFSGGSGSAIGAFIGMLIVVASRNLVVLTGISVYWKDLGIALVLLAAVLLNRPKSD
jgi:ribose transport system permease protein